MREGFVLYDEQGKEIWACANVDARGTAEVGQLKGIRPRLEEDIYAFSGQAFALGALPRLLWIKNNRPEIYQKAKTLTMLNDWLVYRLSGVLTAEPSNGCTTGIFDIKKRRWHREICDMCGIRGDIFPNVTEPCEKVGFISERASAVTGLLQTIPVVTGGGDAQLGALGAGIVKEGQAAVFGGSFWQLEYNTKNPIIDKDCRIRVNCHAIPDMWQYEAIAFFPGLIMRWFRDAFCAHIADDSKKIYAVMNEQAAKVPPGSNGMMCAFSDVMNYISWKHASPTFTNFAFDAERFSVYTFCRAIMENAALVTKGHVELVESITGGRPKEILFANGASNSPLWCQIMADVLQTPMRVPAVKESTALGAAICAGVGAGVYRDTDEACERLVKIEKTYMPNRENGAVYGELYNKWRKMYGAQLKLADEGFTKHMWKAAGL
jgi:autoinducer 2 (AI-2) kinase